jgi:hypothetical protein
MPNREFIFPLNAWNRELRELPKIHRRTTVTRHKTIKNRSIALPWSKMRLNNTAN